MDVLCATIKLLSDLSIHEVSVGDGEDGVGHLPALIVLVLTRGDLGALGEGYHLYNTYLVKITRKGKKQSKEL